MALELAKGLLFLRSFWIQGLANYRWMQGNGYEYALRRNARRKDGSVPFFNTHPWLSAGIIGLSGKTLRSGSDLDEGRLKLRWMGTLGAVGDGIIWTVLRPMTVLVGLLVLAMKPQLFWLLPIIFLVFSVVVRWFIFMAGWKGEDALVALLESVSPPSYLKFGRQVVPVLALVATGIVAVSISLHPWTVPGLMNPIGRTGLVFSGAVWILLARTSAGARASFLFTLLLGGLWQIWQVLQ